MPGSSRRTRSHRAQAGFTLLELVIVLVIMGLLLAQVAARTGPPSPRLTLDEAADEIADALRDARATAILRRRPMSVSFDVAKRTWQGVAAGAHTLPKAVDLVVTSASTAASAAGDGRATAVFRFDPDGSATGGSVELGLGTRHVVVAINWLTGHVSVAHGG